ncbi:oligosaccharide flippase family protein, partial [Lacisediminimonas sp.]|uniref:oligosaccharide flippase family protein n=1 Tax=Lacisediminimonas sp. TaxID=3060582 RepID=UPI002727E549
GFGIVTLIGSVIGYFGVLDVNLSAGAIKYLAESHAAGERRRFAETFWFGAMFYGALGAVGGLAIFLSAGWLLDQFFTVSASLHADTVLALQIGAVGFAVTQVQNYLITVPQALQRYDRSAQSEAFFGIAVSVASVLVAIAGGGIAGVIAVRIGVSILNVAYLVWLLHSFKLDMGICWPGPAVRRGMTSFSAYAYLSKLASTLHQHGDKLIIGSLAGPVALAFYTVPATLAGRILGLTYRLSSVIYPRASALAATNRLGELRIIYFGAMRHITYINLIALGTIVLAGEEFLRQWVGEEFVAAGYPVLVLMTLAMMVDSLTNIPSLVNDALGHPRITGRFALVRAVVGVSLVYAGCLLSGIVGATVGHLIATLVLGASFLLYVHGRTVPFSFSDSVQLGWGRSAMVGLLVFGAVYPVTMLLPGGVAGTIAATVIGLTSLGAAYIVFIANIDERAAMLSVARRLVS